MKQSRLAPHAAHPFQDPCITLLIHGKGYAIIFEILVNLFGNTSNIYGSYFFPSSDSPQFRNGGIILSSFAAGGVVLAIVFALYLHRLNMKAEKLEEVDGQIRYKYIW
jgi:hypothetical protein